MIVYIREVERFVDNFNLNSNECKNKYIFIKEVSLAYF